MARKQTKSQDPETGDSGREEAETTTPPAKGATISKADAIRAALKAGIDSPAAAETFIRKRFGIDVSRTHFSAFKSQTKKAESMKGIEGYLAPPPKLEATGDGDLLDALEKMKPLVASLGAEKVKRIVDLLG